MNLFKTLIIEIQFKTLDFCTLTSVEDEACIFSFNDVIIINLILKALENKNFICSVF